MAVWEQQRLIIGASHSTSTLHVQEFAAMKSSDALRMELSSTATTNGATSFVREAVEWELGLGEGEEGGEGAQGPHSHALNLSLY